MKALWLENQQLQLQTDLSMPIPPAGEARIRVLRVGICNTDLELLQGGLTAFASAQQRGAMKVLLEMS